jgi:hypothetical protein
MGGGAYLTHPRLRRLFGWFVRMTFCICQRERCTGAILTVLSDYHDTFVSDIGLQAPNKSLSSESVELSPLLGVVKESEGRKTLTVRDTPAFMPVVPNITQLRHAYTPRSGLWT